MPPPNWPVELPLRVQLVSAAVPAWMPPPNPVGPAAELPLTVLLLTVNLLRAEMPPPVPAELPLTVLWVRVAMEAARPPPRPRAVLPPTAQLASAAVTA